MEWIIHQSPNPRDCFPPLKSPVMRYLVTARLQSDRKRSLLEAIEDRSLGRGSVAGGEYLRNMKQARRTADGRVRWVEVCFCPKPLLEERPYWEEYFDLERVQDAHDRNRCRDLNGQEPWACTDCDCTERLEKKLKDRGQSFLKQLTARDEDEPS